MKVYITTCKDGFGGYGVDRVFAKKIDAIDSLMAKYPGEFYSGLTRKKVEDNCQQLISEYEVE